MTMLRKNTYTIDGEKLQERILSVIESLKYDYCEWQEYSLQPANNKDWYANYVADVEVLRELLRLQGLYGVENQMIIDYVKDLAENEIDNSNNI